MPANLTPDYLQADARFRAAVTREERIEALEEMLRLLPRHKGTDKLHADLRARLSKLRLQPRSAAAKAFSRHIPREGAGQVVLVGCPNAGKSSLVVALTHAAPEVAPYPRTTREPTPGMMPYEDVAIQLVDLPPLCREHVEPWVYDLVRAADLAWLVVELEEALDGVDTVAELLGTRGLALHPARADAGASADASHPGRVSKPALLVVTGMDVATAERDLGALREMLGTPWPLAPVSTVSGAGLDALRQATFEALGVVRVYTKEPGKDPDRRRPFTLPTGSTVGDLARTIHNDIAAKLRFARVWGHGAFAGQQVGETHVLADRDVVELHV